MIIVSGASFPGVTFDGITTYLSKSSDYTGNSDSSTGIVSFWFRIEGTANKTWYVLGSDANSTGGFSVQRLSGAGGSFTAPYGFNISLASNASNRFQFGTTAGFTSSSAWHHLLASWNTNASSGARTSHLYIDDVSDRVTNIDTGSAFNADYTQSTHSVAADTAGSEKFYGDLAEVYFAPGQYLDFSNSANRRKFITDALKPVELGSTGQFPTGVAPILYLSGSKDTFATNKGTGGGMTITGTLIDSNTRPGT